MAVEIGPAASFVIAPGATQVAFVDGSSLGQDVADQTSTPKYDGADFVTVVGNDVFFAVYNASFTAETLIADDSIFTGATVAPSTDFQPGDAFGVDIGNIATTYDSACSTRTLAAAAIDRSFTW